MKLPQPDHDARAHSEKLKAIIAHEIAQQGPIPFVRYMQMALYQPGLGYYSAGAQKFGSSGDFVTAPELSPMFSRCIARQCAQVIAEFDEAIILEFGAGTGALALTVLRELERCEQLPVRYYILEVSADLRARQRQLFATEAPHFLARLAWLDALPEQPLTGVILANEVIDAMPVHRFVMEDDVLKEYSVGLNGGEFEFIKKPADQVLAQALEALKIKFTNGYSSEINLTLPAWIQSLSASLAQGVMLFIDYGYTRTEYYHPQRSMGTLLCHFRQRAHDAPLLYPGIQDITASVDFTAVALAAVSAGLEVCGFTHQAAFLFNCGLLNFVGHDLAVTEHYALAQQIKRLTLPTEMGERFKAIALGKQFSQPLLGFSSVDLRPKL